MKTLRTTWFEAEAVFPVVGDAHPLRRAYARSATRALALASCVHLALFSGFQIAARLQEPPALPGVRIINLTRLPMPPPIVHRDAAPAIEEVIPISPPAVGIPEPVKDWLDPGKGYATNDEMQVSYEPFDPSLTGAGGEDVVLRIPEAELGADPRPDDFVATEEDPFLISLPAPIYPEIARQAEVEGTVVIRALVGKDGRVKEAFVTESIPMLDEAALEAARLAVFKPALQQHRPVAVWVQIPMRFRLQ